MEIKPYPILYTFKHQRWKIGRGTWDLFLRKMYILKMTRCGLFPKSKRKQILGVINGFPKLIEWYWPNLS